MIGVGLERNSPLTQLRKNDLGERLVRACIPNQSPRREENKETSPYCSRQGVPASVVKVPLSEYQPLMPIDGPPKNQEKNANSCRS